MIVYYKKNNDTYIDNNKVKYTINNIVFDVNNKIINNEYIINYMISLRIPPAYKNVEFYYYSKNDNSKEDGVLPKILYIGYDSKNRKQVIYSKSWREEADKNKFNNLIMFAKKLPSIVKTIDKYIDSNIQSKNKLISLILKIIIYCGFRIGNEKYEKLYNSHGISNIKLHHLNITDEHIDIEFKGKKGVINTCKLTDKKIIDNINKLVLKKSSNDIVFHYKKKNDSININSKSVNLFLQNINKHFTTKMFRIFYANKALIDFLKKIKPSELSLIKRKKQLVLALKSVSSNINNTPNICKKSYINSFLINMYLNKPMSFEKSFINNNTSRINFINFLKTI